MRTNRQTDGQTDIFSSIFVYFMHIVQRTHDKGEYLRDSVVNTQRKSGTGGIVWCISGFVKIMLISWENINAMKNNEFLLQTSK
jgi:hypothetical protein